MSDGYEEANNLLSATLEQLDDILLHGHRLGNERRSGAYLSSPSTNPPPLLATKNNPFRIIEMKRMETDENGNGKENREAAWEGSNGWTEQGRRDSTGSSGAESPPTDLPTSSASSTALCTPFEMFVKALEKDQLMDRPDLETQIKILRWMTRCDEGSPSPSMSSVSCPEYPELQDKLQRLAMARDSLTLQVSVLSEQVSAQKEKIRDLESVLTGRRGDELHSERLSHADEVDARQLDIMAEVSNLKMKFAAMEREKNEAERKLHLSQSEMDHLNQSMGRPQMHLQQHGAIQRQNDEVEQLRDAVHRLIQDNEAKNQQISNLRHALEAQQREAYTVYQSPRYQPQADGYDFNAQLRKLLMDESGEMAHSSSFPLSLCSSNPNAPPSSRSAVQSSSSFNSSLSAASPPSSWCHTPTQRGPNNAPHLNPSMQYRSPSSPAARQLAAELDELRRIGPMNVERGPHTYSTASLPRSTFNKTQSTLTLPGKKLSVASSSGECGERESLSSSTSRPSKVAREVNRWIAEKLRGRSKKRSRATSVPNLVESDDEITRGRLTAATSTLSVNQPQQPLRRDRTRSSLRNLFSKFARSNSQDQSGQAFRRGSAARSTSSARLGSSTNGPLSGPIALRPPLEVFQEWRGEQLAEWMGEIGYAYLAPTVAAMVRSGRVFLQMDDAALERDLGIRNALHRKRILLILRKIEKNSSEVIDKWDLHQVVRWLEDIGLPQYKEVFTEFIVDGPMLLSLTATDMVEMRITSALHYATIARSIDRLRRSECKMNGLVRKFDPSILSTYPCPEVVSRWSQQATCEWLQTIDLAEFTPNLLCAGVPGALMVYDPSFTAETLAEIMHMPAHKTLLRRHLSTHFNQLIGQKIVSAKRDFLAQGHWPQMNPNLKIKVVRKGFSLTRKRAKGEICVEPDELLHKSLPASVTVENGTEVTSNI
ncbi:hypothetical protein PMAYCL1PPCAC_33206 [Pristionchus mayeri]|uniref:SAM domain-containing protein n=1 Tax=Pristionchus mayeri TaxID=1317129 RepID=A0AAN5DHA9_9BILA|nr:hypothetical protein PMAYCL1PPCAC_33206 [Pristionchus mayeri]